MSLARIATVTALAGHRLRLGLTDGNFIEREVGPLLEGAVFKEIRETPELFAQVEAQGGTVVWPNGADLCPDVLIWVERLPLTPLPARNATCSLRDNCWAVPWRERARAKTFSVCASAAQTASVNRTAARISRRDTR